MASRKSNKKFANVIKSRPVEQSRGVINKFSVLDMDEDQSDSEKLNFETSAPTIELDDSRPDKSKSNGSTSEKLLYDNSKSNKSRSDKSEHNNFVSVATETLPESEIPTPSKKFVPSIFQDDGGWKSSSVSKSKKKLEKDLDKSDDRSVNKQLYVDDEKIDNDEMGNNLFLQSSWTVWTHQSDCPDWTEESYTNIYVINSVGSFWRFFNNFHLFDKSRNQLFIMRNKIKPIWEDNENRKGGICSIKLDCFNKQGKIDMGTDIMVCISLLIMNETFLTNNAEINGISYSIKNKSVLIKLWCKNFNYDITGKLPISLFNKLDTTLRSMDKFSYGSRKSDNKMSIRYTPIKPEYDVEK